MKKVTLTDDAKKKLSTYLKCEPSIIESLEQGGYYTRGSTWYYLGTDVYNNVYLACLKEEEGTQSFAIKLQ